MNNSFLFPYLYLYLYLYLFLFIFLNSCSHQTKNNAFNESELSQIGLTYILKNASKLNIYDPDPTGQKLIEFLNPKIELNNIAEHQHFSSQCFYFKDLDNFQCQFTYQKSPSKYFQNFHYILTKDNILAFRKNEKHELIEHVFLCEEKQKELSYQSPECPKFLFLK